MSVQAMGYFWVGTSKLDDWASFASGQLGLEAVDRGGAMRAFRMDDRKQRLIFDGGFADGERFSVGRSRTRRTSMHWPRGSRRRASPSGVNLLRWRTSVASRRSFRFATRPATASKHSTAARSPTNRSALDGIRPVFAPGPRAWDMPC